MCDFGVVSRRRFALAVSGLFAATWSGGCVLGRGRGSVVKLGEADPPLLIFRRGVSGWGEAEGVAGVGEVVRESPVIRVEGGWNELVVSWNVEPAEGAGLVVEAQAGFGTGWTGWYRLGDWSLEGTRPVVRTSPARQSDVDGLVKTDTLVVRRLADAMRLRVRMTGELAEEPSRLRWVTASWCDTGRVPGGRPSLREVWGRVLEVPERSQVAYEGGSGWCSPTSVSMMMAWWAREMRRPELDRDVPEVARGVHDPGWPGTGNWPFNTAYAGSFRGIRACAARLRDFRDVEALVLAGIPVVLSVNAPALRGRPVAPDGGHLVICVGFTPEGDVVANDPWARLEQGQRVRREYRRTHVETAWSHAHRLAYLIAPEAMVRRFPAVWR